MATIPRNRKHRVPVRRGCQDRPRRRPPWAGRIRRRRFYSRTRQATVRAAHRRGCILFRRDRLALEVLVSLFPLATIRDINGGTVKDQVECRHSMGHAS